jgi:hypothetical protein
MEIKTNVDKMSILENLPNVPNGITFTIGDVTFKLSSITALGLGTMNNIETENFEGHADIISEPKEYIATEICWAFKASDGKHVKSTEELYQLIDWKHPYSFCIRSWHHEPTFPSDDTYPKQLNVCGEVYEVWPPRLVPAFHERSDRYFLYESNLYYPLPDGSLPYVGTAKWWVYIVDEDTDEIKPGVVWPPKHNDDYFSYTNWKLPTEITLWVSGSEVNWKLKGPGSIFWDCAEM